MQDRSENKQGAADATVPVTRASKVLADLLARPLQPGLYLVATPIGNLGDISLRALSVLARADLIAAEDTRHSKKLLSHFGLRGEVTPYHEHNAEKERPRLIARLRAEQSVALISDAGTPLISDPGYKLVQAAIAEGVPVTPIPGPSAILTALVVSGLPTDRFFFEGFLPPRSGARRARLAELAQIPGTLMLFEGPHRLPEMLADAAAVLGERPAVVARELTKLFETVRRGPLPQLAQEFAKEGPPKGEIVVLIGEAAERQGEEVDAEVDEKLATALRRHSIKDAAALVADETGRPKREVYARALSLAKASGGDGGGP